MTDVQLYFKLLDLPSNLKNEVEDFIDFLKQKSKKSKGQNKRVSGKAKGLIRMKENFDDPISGFDQYMK